MPIENNTIFMVRRQNELWKLGRNVAERLEPGSRAQDDDYLRLLSLSMLERRARGGVDWAVFPAADSFVIKAGNQFAVAGFQPVPGTRRQRVFTEYVVSNAADPAVAEAVTVMAGKPAGSLIGVDYVEMLAGTEPDANINAHGSHGA